jgi:GTP pyrophosphokinase
MRTLQFHTEERQLYIAKETLELYAPLANRLGINWMKTELEDLSFLFLYPRAFTDLAKRIEKKRDERTAYTEEVKAILRRETEKVGLKAVVEGRPKHFYGIYRKMQEQQITFDEVYDLTAFRIILESNVDKECYEALSMVHALWKPVPGRFKDYIAMPKANNYRSLHTTVIGPYGERMEVQIRTRAMHEWAEEGIAAHWRYKEKRKDQKDDDRQIKKLRELLEVQQELKNPREFMSNLKLALFPDEVYVFTPGGDVRSFPKGATPIDFAYSIHTDVGNKCIGAKVNRTIVPIKYELQNGDTVEIITQAGHHPSKDWLKFAVTSRARSKIKSWIKTEERKKSVLLGKDLLEKEFRRHPIKFTQFVKSEELQELLKEQNVDTLDDLLALIGYGKLSARHIVNRMLPEEPAKLEEVQPEKPVKKTAPSSVGISLTGIEDVMVRFARCCEPIPGDDIIGYISRGRGITIHMANCPNAQDMDAERLVEVEWHVKDRQTFPVQLRVVCRDKKGILAEVSGIITARDVNISHAEVETNAEMKAVCTFRMDVRDLKQFNEVVADLKKLKDILTVERTRKS